MKKGIGRKKGIIAAELIIGLIFLTFAGAMAVTLLNIGYRNSELVEDEEIVQKAFRDTSDLVVNSVRESTGIFIMPKSSFNKKNIDSGKYLSDGWDYVGIVDWKEDGKTKSEIVEYKWNKVNKNHDKIVLVESNEKFYYDFKIYKDYSSADKKFINFELEAFLQSADDSPHIEIKSKAEALNSLQVISWSSTPGLSELDPGSAIAYRSEDREYSSGGGVVRVVMVLDCSGSMQWYMDSDKIAPVRSQRITFLKKAASDMVDKFAEVESIDMVIIPFSTTANFGRWADTTSGSKKVEGHHIELYGENAKDFSFVNVKERQSDIKSILNALKPLGGTNISDSLRRAYYVLKQAEEKDGPADMEVMIHLTDGNPTFYPLENNTASYKYLEDYYNAKLYTKDGDIDKYTTGNMRFSSRYRYNSNSRLPTGFTGSLGTAKDYLLGGMGNDADIRCKESIGFYGKDLKERPNLKNYIIAMSNDVSSESIGLLQDALDPVATYKAIAEEDLYKIFDEIGKTVIEDTWFIDGPSKLPE